MLKCEDTQTAPWDTMSPAMTCQVVAGYPPFTEPPCTTSECLHVPVSRDRAMCKCVIHTSQREPWWHGGTVQGALLECWARNVAGPARPTGSDLLATCGVAQPAMAPQPAAGSPTSAPTHDAGCSSARCMAHVAGHWTALITSALDYVPRLMGRSRRYLKPSPTARTAPHTQTR